MDQKHLWVMLPLIIQYAKQFAHIEETSTTFLKEIALRKRILTIYARVHNLIIALLTLVLI